MIYKCAKKLHSHDEVIIKETSEIVEIISTELYKKEVFVYAMTKNGYAKFNHRYIK